MQTASPDRPSRFPLIFEGLVWSLYAGLYKYNDFMMEAARLHRPVGHPNFPYPQLILFALLATLYLVPYHRWLVPGLLRRRRYALLGVVAVV